MRIFRSMEAKPMHLLVLPRWYPHPADPQNGSFIAHFAKAMANRVAVTVIFPYPAADPQSAEVIDYGDCIEIRVPYQEASASSTPSILIKAGQVFRYRRALLHGVSIMLQHHGKPDIIHAQILTRTAFYAHRFAKKWNIPWLLTEHNSELYTPKNIAWPRRITMLKMCRRADKLVAVSDALARALTQFTGRKDIEVIPNLIAFSKMPPISWENSTGKLQIAAVCDLVDDVKNISGLLRALRSVVDELLPFELHIVGDGPDRNRLETLARELKLESYVQFLGRMEHTEVLRFLPNIDFLVVNSHRETFSIVAAEAISFGKPVIITRCGGPQEWFKPQYGIMVEPNNDGELATALVKMAQTHGSYSAEELAAEIRVQFDPKKILDTYQNIYQQLLK